MLVACYCRVSTEEQVKFGFSIDAQKDALTKYCKENKLKCEFFIDEGISASSMKRPALQNMLSRLKDFDTILFTKLDRLSRNVLDANTINKMLIQNKCTMKAIDEDDIDTSTADGTFMFNLKVSLAQREIEKTSERINFVFNNKREKGEATSGTKKYGYDIINKKYVINKKEAENIYNLFKFFISVNGDLKTTYSYFIKEFSGKGRDAMSKYLRDTSYIGKYKLYRKDIYLDNYIPAIIDIDLWNKAQSLLKKKTITRHNTYEDAFSGLLYCNECGNRMSKKVDYRCKNIIVRYVCDAAYRTLPGTTEKKCHNTKIIREPEIEKYLLENIKKEIEKYIVKFKQKSSSKSTDNTQKVQSLKHKLAKLKELFVNDLIDIETYKADYNKYQNEIKDLTNASAPEKKDFTKLEQIINLDILTIYSNLSTAEKKQFWLSLIDKIYVENGEIKEITFL
jgi:DNA invertase Pin-like site-specific DNA recombinase